MAHLMLIREWGIVIFKDSSFNLFTWLTFLIFIFRKPKGGSEMKRTRKPAGMVVGLIMLFVLATGTMAHAYPFEDMIDTWTCLGIDSVPILQGCPLTYTHDIRDSVNFAAGDRVTSATLQLDFTNDIPEIEICPPLFEELVRVAYDGSAWQYLGDVDNGQYEIVLNINWLNDNGFINVVIEVTDPCLATAYLDHSLLYGTAECASVPEPGSLILLGIGLIGVVALGRRKFLK